MEYLTEENLVILWFMGFFSHMAYLWGKRIGIENAIDYFADNGYIDLDYDSTIYRGYPYSC